jgi:N6-adenosine-specific RNA methylase IME4
MTLLEAALSDLPDLLAIMSRPQSRPDQEPNGLEPHPLAALIPAMSDDEYIALMSDIEDRGLQEPVVMFEGKILDGRHRYRACREMGRGVDFTEYTGDDPLGYVASLNVHRRHLTASQRAVIALEVEKAFASEAKQRQGTRTDLGRDLPEMVPESRERAAKVARVNSHYVSDAKRIESEAPDLLPKVSAGTMTLPEAKKEIRQREKAKRVAAIADQVPAPIQSLGPFPVLLADPPWRYEDAEPTRAVENNYPTMTLDEIKALDVPACDDSVLFLWATSPKLTEALEVMDAWGFTYRTCAVWVKDKIGMGYYFRQQHELLLVGKRGTLPVPDPEDRPSSVLAAPRAEHSAKPESVYALLERMYPTIERVELFAREPRNGWAAWGNQV